MDDKYKAIIHYASPYYDPVKAHEYYERTKQLKGRTSSSSSTSTKQSAKSAAKKAAAERKAAASLYVKKRINDEKDSRLKDNEALLKQEVKAHTNKMASSINKLRSEIAALSKSGVTSSGKNAAVVKSEISKLREANAKQIQKLQALHGKKATQIKKDYQTKLDKEIAKINKEKF